MCGIWQSIGPSEKETSDALEIGFQVVFDTERSD